MQHLVVIEAADANPQGVYLHAHHIGDDALLKPPLGELPAERGPVVAPHDQERAQGACPVASEET